MYPTILLPLSTLPNILNQVSSFAQDKCPAQLGVILPQGFNQKWIPNYKLIAFNEQP